MKRIACAVAACLYWLAAAPAVAVEPPVYITEQQPWLDVIHDGKLVRIRREQDSFGQIDPDYAMTSRPCPPYCIQPMVIATGVETIGELELLGYLRRISQRDRSLMVIDSRDHDWLQRSGIIPGAVSIPWRRLHSRHSDPEHMAEILELQFDASRVGQFWNFENAKTLVFYCNGAWCGQSPTNIKQLLAIGYPAHKLKWYRGGMQSWKSLGLNTVAFKPPAEPAAP